MDNFTWIKDNYSYLKRICKDMKNIDISDKDKKGFELVSFFEKITAENWEITFEIHERFREFVWDLSKWFTAYYLNNIAHLNSSFSIRIYELLKQFEDTGWRQLSIEDLRDKLLIDKNNYKLYGNFRQRIILVAQKELEEKTDIRFDFEEIKKGRKVVSIKFKISKISLKKNKNQITVKDYIEEKKQEAKELLNENEFKLYEKLCINGITSEVALELIKDDNILNSVINKNIDYVNELEENKHPFKVWKTNFLMAAIKENYSGNNRIKRNHNKKIAKKKEEKEKEKDEEQEKIRKEKQKIKNKRRESLTKKRQNKLLEQYKIENVGEYQNNEFFIKKRIFSDYQKWKRQKN